MNLKPLKSCLPGIAGILMVLSIAASGCTPGPADIPATTATSQVPAPLTSTVVENPAHTTPVNVTSSTEPPYTPLTTDTAEYVPFPAPGFEFKVPLEYDNWTVLDFEYRIEHNPGENYHFPWTLVIQNDSGQALPLVAYIIHWGFHGWVGFVTETPFTLEAGETRTVSGEDVFGEAAYEQMLYLESTHLEVYIAGQ